MEKKIKNGLLAFVFIILLLPFLQQNLKVIDSGKLYGFYTDNPDVDFTMSKWFDGSYQESKAKFYNDHLGFRPDLLRLNNELAFLLFDKIYDYRLVFGQNDYLYQGDYIDAYYGVDFIGYDAIIEKSRKLKAIQDTLARMGKSLIVVYAPSKACFYPEYFPERRMHNIQGPTNFDVCRHVGDSLGINRIDFNTWFLSMKGKSKELLFSKQGVHWTVYGSLLGGDSLVKYIEKLRNIRMPHAIWSSVVHTQKARDTDDDIARLLNLIFPFTTETFCYPNIHYAEDTAKKKPNAIYIGDSFVLNLIGNGTIPNVHANWEFWNSFSGVYSENPPYVEIKDYDWKNAIKKTDCIVLEHTTYTLRVFGYGFIEQAYDYYYPKK